MSLNIDKSAWKRVVFGDVVGNVNETVRNTDAAGIDRIIAMEHLDPGELKISRWGSTDTGTTFTRRVKPGQTLFGKRRAYQRKVAYAEFDAICSGDIYTFEADETQMLGELLPFLVQSNGFLDHALGTSVGSLSPRTNWRDLTNFKFDLPPLDEQERIADLLWAIEAHRLQIQSELSLVRDERIRLIDRLVDAAIAAKAVPLSDVAEIRGGVQKGKAVKGISVERPYLAVSNVQAGRVDLTTIKTMSVSEADAERFALRHGDVLMTEGGDIDKLGRGTVWQAEIPDCLHQNHVFAVRTVRSAVLPEWIGIHTESTHGRAYFRVAAKRTSNLASVNKTQVSNFPVGRLSLDDQTSAVKRVGVADGAIRALVEELATLTTMALSISAQVFGGA